jgi:hypothetical protein
MTQSPLAPLAFPWRSISRHMMLVTAFAFALALPPASAVAQANKPNILVIMGDDIGWFNPSCYNRGMMGYETPNIDRIAKEGALFTCWYGQQSCTAGRAAFVTGQRDRQQRAGQAGSGERHMESATAEKVQ